MLIDGFVIDKRKSLKINVCENIHKELGIPLHPDAIKHVSRFGAIGEDGMPKSLRVKFHNSDIKNELLAQKGRLRGTNIYFREHLTPRQLDILTQSKIAEHNKVIYKAWPKNGLIYGMDTETSRPKLIYDLDALLSINLAMTTEEGEGMDTQENGSNPTSGL